MGSRHDRVGPHDEVLGVVEKDGPAVGEDEDVAVEVEVNKGVEVVLGAGVPGLAKEGEHNGGHVGRVSLGIKLVAELATTAYDYRAAVGKDVIGGVPPPDGEGLFIFQPKPKLNQLAMSNLDF